MRTVCPFLRSSCAKRLQVAVVPLVSRLEHSNTNRMFIVDELPYGKANYSQRESEKGSIEFPFSHLERVAIRNIVAKNARENAFPSIICWE